MQINAIQMTFQFQPVAIIIYVRPIKLLRWFPCNFGNTVAVSYTVCVSKSLPYAYVIMSMRVSKIYMDNEMQPFFFYNTETGHIGGDVWKLCIPWPKMIVKTCVVYIFWDLQ